MLSSLWYRRPEADLLQDGACIVVAFPCFPLCCNRLGRWYACTLLETSSGVRVTIRSVLAWLSRACLIIVHSAVSTVSPEHVRTRVRVDNSLCEGALVRW